VKSKSASPPPLYPAARHGRSWKPAEIVFNEHTMRTAQLLAARLQVSKLASTLLVGAVAGSRQ
jgi:hypothetical protein